LAIKISGFVEEVLQECPDHDWDCMRAIAEIMACTWFYQSALISLVGFRLASSPWTAPLVLLSACFLSTFILLIDGMLVLRSGHHLQGIRCLKRGGIDCSGGAWERIKAGCSLLLRTGIAVADSMLVAIVAGLILFAPDINSQEQKADLAANQPLVAPATALVDAGIRRAGDAVNAQTARINALASQIGTLRQIEIDPVGNNREVQELQQEVVRLTAQKTAADDEVSKAESFTEDEYSGIRGAPGNSGIPGYGLKFRAAAEKLANAKGRAERIDQNLTAARERLDALRKQLSSSDDAILRRSHDQLNAFEQSLDAENAKLTALKGELARLTTSRESAIRRAVETAPNYVAPDNGLLGQIMILERLAQSDSKIAMIIILIDLVSFSLEMAGVLAKTTSFVPTTYSMLLARDAYMRAVRMANEMMIELETFESRRNGEPEIMPPDEPIEDVEAPGLVPEQSNGMDGADLTPPKRGRGRPPKHAVPDSAAKGTNGQEEPKPPQDLKKSA